MDTGVPVLHGVSNATIRTDDVDGDGRADLLYANATRCVVYRGNANRTLTPFGVGLPNTASSAAGNLEVADLDNDGLPEILMWSPFVAPSLWRTDGLGNWFSVPSFTLPASGAAFALLDVDADGDRDIVRSGDAFAYSYAPSGVQSIPIAPFVFREAVALDHDRDGREDLVFVAPNAPSLMMARNLGGAVFASAPLPTGQGFRALGTIESLGSGDLDGDTFPDLVAGFATEPTLVWRNTVTGAAPFGASCDAPGFVAPQLSVQGAVAAGLTPVLELDGAMPNGLACFWVGLDKRTFAGQPVLPLDLTSIGAPGCSLYTEPLVLVCVVADATGTATIPIPLPALTGTAPLALFTQAAVLAPGANPLQGLFSNGLALKVR